MMIIFSRCHFRATYLGLKAMQAEGPKLGLYADLEGKSKANKSNKEG